MAEEIDLSPGEEVALAAAWERLGKEPPGGEDDAPPPPAPDEKPPPAPHAPHA